MSHIHSRSLIMLGGRKLASSSHLLLLISMITPGSAVQFCGNDLSDALAMVCAETGYNMPTLVSSDSADDRRYPREAGGRQKRGIVDECCRSPCGWATIETYCRPQPSSTSENLQIQKRSDPPSDDVFKQQVEAYSISHPVEQGVRHQKRRLFSQAEDAVVIKNNRVFHSLLDDRRSEISVTSNKVKRNEKRKPLDEEHKNPGGMLHNPPDSGEKKVEELKHGKFKLHELQYLQTRHHRANKFHHKSLVKGKSSQVGTVSPYYFGKFLVSPKARRLPF
ncbi:hypothetical protein GE061_000765 [Apolygus lucorum]|uniref:Insulin-like domain-containing protein n=1 Tax=Apolygus lucorum TaxID=248454 RepID=A0A8S9Y5H2_APOLU|nr:hypothetical protein GE061_000765 [Apolygus lucorum]